MLFSSCVLYIQNILVILMTFYSTSVNALSPANSAVHKYLHSSIKDRKLRSRISYTVPERFTSNLKYITPWKIVRNQTMHLKKAPVLILLVGTLMCLEAGKFILILYFTPYNRTISMSKTVIDVGRSVHYLIELTGQE